MTSMKFRRPYSCSPTGPIATIALSSTSSDRFEHVVEDRLRDRRVELRLGAHGAERAGPCAASDATLREHSREQLLRHEVHGLAVAR